MSDRKTGYSPLNAENNRRVTNDVMFAYVHTKIIILQSVLSIFSFFFYDFNLNTQGFVYLVSTGPPYKRASFRKILGMHICYTVVLYTDMSRFSFYIEINRIAFRC